MRTLIFGGDGQLGRDLRIAFRSGGEVLACTRAEVDISDDAQVYGVVKAFSPDLVLNAAAYTDVEGAEDDLEAAFLVNEAGARHVADAAAYHQAPVVYFSTDYVFGDTQTTPYTPQSALQPTGVYARSKAAGEAATRKSNPMHFIIRTAWLYGPGGNNFVEKILRQAATRTQLRVVEDEVGSPTHTLDLAEATYYLTRTRQHGTYHVVNRGACSRYELARAILSIAELPVEVAPCSSEAYPSKARRPRYSVLDPSAAEAVMNHRMRPWKEALLEYMQRREATV